MTMTTPLITSTTPGLLRVGAIGHRFIPDDEVVTRLRTQARALFAEWQQTYPHIEIHSQLAVGADTLLTEVALEFGAKIVNVIPFASFEEDFSAAELPVYLHLRKQAKIIDMPFESRSDEAYLAAGHYVVDTTDVLLAAWDGKEARGKGGTADIVDYANVNQKLVISHETPR